MTKRKPLSEQASTIVFRSVPPTVWLRIVSCLFSDAMTIQALVVAVPMFSRWMWREGAPAGLVLRTALGRFWQCVFCRQISATPYRLRDCGHIACGLCIWKRGLPSAPLNQLFIPILFHCQCGSSATRRPRRANAVAANVTAHWILGKAGRARQCALQPRLFPLAEDEADQPTLFSSFCDDSPDPFFFVGFPGDYIDGDFVGAVTLEEVASGQLFSRAFPCLVFALRCKLPDRRTHDGYFTFSIFKQESQQSGFRIRQYGDICDRFTNGGVDWTRLTPHDTIVLSRCRDSRPFRSCIITGWTNLASAPDLEFVTLDMNRLDASSSSSSSLQTSNNNKAPTRTPLPLSMQNGHYRQQAIPQQNHFHPLHRPNSTAIRMAKAPAPNNYKKNAKAPTSSSAPPTIPTTMTQPPPHPATVVSTTTNERHLQKNQGHLNQNVYPQEKDKKKEARADHKDDGVSSATKPVANMNVAQHDQSQEEVNQAVVALDATFPPLPYQMNENKPRPMLFDNTGPIIAPPPPSAPVHHQPRTSFITAKPMVMEEDLLSTPATSGPMTRPVPYPPANGGAPASQVLFFKQ